MPPPICFSLLLIPAFSLIVGPACAQGQKPYPHATPIDNVTADPVQGGALSEYHKSGGDVSDPSRGVAGSHPRHYEDAGSSRRRAQSGPGSDGIDTSDIPPPAPIHELVVQTKQGLRWLCGGIGKREVEYIKSMANDFDVMLTFATVHGAYLADVDVRIVDEKERELLHMRCDAPILLVDLPQNGNYRIYADVDGHTIKRLLSIPPAQKGGQHVVLAWPLPASEIGGGKTDPVGNRDEQIKSRGR